MVGRECRKKKEEEGMSLIEVMVAALIGVAVVAIAATVLTGSDKASHTNSQVAQTQQNARIAMDMLAEDLKIAGFGMTGTVGGCTRAIMPGDNVNTGALNAINDKGPDRVSMVLPFTSSVAPLWTIAAPQPQPNPLLPGYSGPDITLTTGAVATIPASYTALGSIFSLGGSFSGTVKVTAGDKITFNDPLGATTVFPIGTRVYALQCITYQVIPPPDTANNVCGGTAPCLVRGAVAGLDCNILASPCVPVADGIEDLQIAYACDGCVTALPDRAVDDMTGSVAGFDTLDFVSNTDWAAAPAWFATPLSANTIRLARITVVARETSPDQGTSEGSKPAQNTSAPLVIEDHNPANGVFIAPGGAGNDFSTATYPLTQRRRVLTRTVDTRNIGN
jgi:type IV pilus assembly protein PilW